MANNLVIENPKQDGRMTLGRSNWYPFYAGFSSKFAHSIIKSSSLMGDALVIDPWNGSGTTTTAASMLGVRAIGFDLNPVMVVIAKARLVDSYEKHKLSSSLAELLEKGAARASQYGDIRNNDPLLEWFVPVSAIYLRSLEIAVRVQYTNEKKDLTLQHSVDVVELSEVGAFFYTVLFRTIKKLIRTFISTNPTWVKRPEDKRFRLKPSLDVVNKIFTMEAKAMIDTIRDDVFEYAKFGETTRIVEASSDSIPIDDGTVDLILASPPYCTRIDYAVATMPELAMLGFDLEGDFDRLRRKLIGSVTVPKSSIYETKNWGATCSEFMERVRSHSSKASPSYYYKNHLQYFDSMFRSIREISKKLNSNGTCILVVQDSFYKDIYNNLPEIIAEMAERNGLILKRRVDFGQARTMAGVNAGTKKYRNTFLATESVLCFVKG